MQLAQPGGYCLLSWQRDAHRDGVNTQAHQRLRADQLGFPTSDDHAKEHLVLPTIATQDIGPTGLQERVQRDVQRTGHRLEALADGLPKLKLLLPIAGLSLWLAERVGRFEWQGRGSR